MTTQDTTNHPAKVIPKISQNIDHMTTTEYGIKNKINSCKQKNCVFVMTYQQKGTKLLLRVQFSATLLNLHLV